MIAKIIHLSTCFPDHFLGNGDRATGIAYIDDATTIGEVLEALADYESWGGFEFTDLQWAALEADVARMRVEHTAELQTVFAASAPAADDSDLGESMFAHFGIEWSSDEN